MRQWEQKSGQGGEETMVGEEVVVVATDARTYKFCGAWKHVLIIHALTYSTEHKDTLQMYTLLWSGQKWVH